MKQPNWKLPLALSATLAIVGTGAYYLEYKHRPEKEKAESGTKKPLFIDEQTQIQSVHIKGAAGTFVFQCAKPEEKKCSPKEVGSWNITSHSGLVADASAVRSFVNASVNLTATDTVDLSEEAPEKQKSLLLEYGLSDEERAKPETSSVEFFLEGGKKVKVTFGSVHPIGDKTFAVQETEAGLNTKTVFLLSNFYKNNFEHKLTHWRDKAIFDFDRHNVSGFTLKSSKGFIFSQKTDGLWKIGRAAGALTHEGDSERIGTLLSTLANAKAREFPSKPNAGATELTLIAKLDDKRSITLELASGTSVDPAGKKTKVTLARGTSSAEGTKAVPGTWVEIDSGTKTQLEKSFNDLRNTRLMNTTDKLSATIGTMSGGGLGATWTFKNEKGNWVHDVAATGNADNKDMKAEKKDGERFKTLLGLLSESQIKEFKTDCKPTQSIVLEVGNAENPAKNRISFWKEKEALIAQDLTSKTKECFWVNDSMKSALPWTKDDWKSK